MERSLLAIRVIFFAIVVVGSWLVAYTVPEWDAYRHVALIVGILLGALVILVDVLLKGFSLRGLTALTFGLFVGWLMSLFISSSPLFEHGDPEILYLVRLTLFVVLMYLATVVALRGRDEFNLVIPYVRFVPQKVEIPILLLDLSTLVDGRVVPLAQSRFLVPTLLVPQFVVDRLHTWASSDDPGERERGRQGLEHLNALRRVPSIELRIHPDDGRGREDRPEAQRLVDLAREMRVKVMSSDPSLIQLARFYGVDWVNIDGLARALQPNPVVGGYFEVELVRKGKEPGQAVGYLSDGSMVVVHDAERKIGQTVIVEVESVLPSGAGRMVFARLSAPSHAVGDG